MQVAAIQFDVRDDETLTDRVGRMVDLIDQQREADLVVLPELWPNGGFSYPSWSDTAEPMDGQLVATMGETARDLGAWLHMGSFVERHGDGSLTNTSVLFTPLGRVQAVYRKIHLFGFGEGEPALMTAGTQVVSADTTMGRLGLSTCYDLRFPEMYRQLVEDGAVVMVIPAAWPASRVEHWSILARARAIENQCFVVAVNTAGTHGGKRMGGASAIIDPLGVVLAEAGEDETVLRADLDLDHLLKWRESFPALGDRRL